MSIFTCLKVHFVANIMIKSNKSKILLLDSQNLSFKLVLLSSVFEVYF